MGQDVSYRALWATPGLPALIGAMTMARLGGRMFSLTLVLFVLARFASPGLAGWLTFAAIAPGLVVSPLAGAFLDRAGPTVAVRIDLVARALFVTLLALVSRLDIASPAMLFGLVILFSLTNPLGASGVRTLLPRLVPPDALDRANAIDTAIYGLVDVLGPGLAGLVVAWLGPEAALLLVAAIYAGAALCLWLVPNVPSLGVDHAASLLRQTWEGVIAVARQPTLRGLAISYSLYQVTWGVLVVVVPVFAAEHFMMQAASLVAGVLWAALGVVGGIGALLAGHLRTNGREPRIMAVGMAVTALAAWPVAAGFGLGGLALGLMMVGAMAGPIDVAVLTLRQRRADPRQLGRVLSISMSLNTAGFPVGSALAGMLITSSLSATFVLAGVASIVGAVATLLIPRDSTPVA